MGITFDGLRAATQSLFERWQAAGIERETLADEAAAIGVEFGQLLEAVNNLRNLERQYEAGVISYDNWPGLAGPELETIGRHIGRVLVRLDMLAFRTCTFLDWVAVTELDRLGVLHQALPEPRAELGPGSSPGNGAVYTEGVCEDGAAILRNGEMIPISEILAALNRMEQS